MCKTRTCSQDQFCSLHLARIKSKKFRAGVWSLRRRASRLIIFYNLVPLWAAMVRMIWSPDQQSGRDRSVLMSLHSGQSFSRVCAGCITETTSAHGNSDARMTVVPDFMCVLCNFNVTKGVGCKCKLRVTSLTQSAYRLVGARFLQERCHIAVTCVKYYLFVTLVSLYYKIFHETTYNTKLVFPTSLLHNIVNISQTLSKSVLWNV